MDVYPICLQDILLHVMSIVSYWQFNCIFFSEEKEPEMTDEEKLAAIIQRYPLMSGREKGMW